MEPTQKTASQILTEAADLLENNTMKWTQGAYVHYLAPLEREPSGPDTCCCAHGAIGYCGSTEIRKLIDQKASGIPTTIAMGVMNWTGVVVNDYGYSYASFLKRYPGFVQFGERTKAHFYAYKVGCSFRYNDTEGRTKEEVIAKLREAAVLAALEP